MKFPILWQGREVWPEKQWVWSRERVEEALRNDEIVFSEARGKVSVRTKQYLKDTDGRLRKGKPISILNGPFNQEGTREVEELLGEGVFSFPKPSALIRYLLSFVVNDDDSKDFVVLDLFAGSGSTAHAVLDLNASDGGNRRFILVQLPEPVEPDTAAGKAGFRTIADICKERVRRVIKKLDAEDVGTLALDGDRKAPDRGFRVYTLAESNFKPWQADGPKDGESLGEHMFEHVEHILPDRSADDLLYEILLKSGFPLTTPVETLELAGKTVSSVAGGALLVCLDRELTLEVIRAMATLKPERVVCLDSGFAGNDQLKANAVLEFRDRGVTSFRTV